MELESIHDIVRKSESNYLRASTKIGKYVNFEMHETIEKIDAYLNSKHTSGEYDSMGREKPFFNIVSAAVNIWWRATDLDTKDVRFYPSKSSSVVLAFVANVILQNWMEKARFGQFLNLWGRALARYGSAIVKFVEQDGELSATVVPWNRFIADPVQFDALPRIEKFYLTPAQLRKTKLYDQKQVDALIEAKKVRLTLDKAQKDVMNEFIELYEVHGELDLRLLEEDPKDVEDKDIKYGQQMHVVSFVGTESDGEYQDFCLYKGKEAKDPYMITHLIEEDGRTLGIGAVEYLFDAQWMQNHTVKNMKDTLDIASKLIFQTADTNFVSRNVLSAIETGDIMVHQVNMPLTRIANDKPDIAALQNFSLMWQNLGQEVTATPDAMRGTRPVSGTPYATTSLLTNQANSLFELMTENKGLAVNDMIRMFVVPFLKKKLKHKEQIAAILDDAGTTEIDTMYIPTEAVRQFNRQAVRAVLNNQNPQPFDQNAAQDTLKKNLAQQGNKRFLVPDDTSESTWAAVFSDFEWDSIRMEVTNEQVDKQAVIQSLTETFKAVVSLAGKPMNEDERLVFTKLMSENGAISPLQLKLSSAAPAALANRVSESISFKDLPPEGQQQMAAQAGIKLQSAPMVGGGLPAKQ